MLPSTTATTHTHNGPLITWAASGSQPDLQLEPKMVKKPINIGFFAVFWAAVPSGAL